MRAARAACKPWKCCCCCRCIACSNLTLCFADPNQNAPGPSRGLRRGSVLSLPLEPDSCQGARCFARKAATACAAEAAMRAALLPATNLVTGTWDRDSSALPRPLLMLRLLCPLPLPLGRFAPTARCRCASRLTAAAARAAAAVCAPMPKLARALLHLTLIAGRGLPPEPPLLAGAPFDLRLRRGAFLLAARAWRDVAAAALATTLRCCCFSSGRLLPLLQLPGRGPSVALGSARCCAAN